MADQKDTEAQAPLSAVDLISEGKLPEDFDPTGDGILMEHQVNWIDDDSVVKLAVKGRRTGITFAEALADTLVASAARSAGGDDVWYIPDARFKSLEFCAVVAHFARVVAKELATVEEFLFEDKRDDGDSKFITAYRVKFASGFRVTGLSSRPENVRGLQGVVVIDEAAFHNDVQKVLDSCLALTTWGGKIRIISTHNGAMNPFNELVKDTEAGKNDYSLHHITFDDAVANGLFERVCLIKGEEPTVEGKAEWYRRERRKYGTRRDIMAEEMDAIPREGSGTVLPASLIEACTSPDFTVVRWKPPSDSFVDWPEIDRRSELERLIDEQIRPAVEKLAGFPVNLGADFGMRRDRSVFSLLQIDDRLTRLVPLIVELFRCPYDQQRQLVRWFRESLQRFAGGIFDANGSGAPLAQEARQMWGPERILELNPTTGWYREHGRKLVTAFEDRAILIPADRIVRDDLRELREAGGVIKIPSDVRSTADDQTGEERHGDAAMSIYYGYVATLGDVEEFAYRPVRRGEASDRRRVRTTSALRGREGLL